MCVDVLSTVVFLVLTRRHEVRLLEVLLEQDLSSKPPGAFQTCHDPRFSW